MPHHVAAMLNRGLFSRGVFSEHLGAAEAALAALRSAGQQALGPAAPAPAGAGAGAGANGGGGAAAPG